MPAWSSEIANTFIHLARERGEALTQMQLQKLVYIAHGWNIVLNDDRLTYDSPEAWDYGPVYRQLRNALSHYGSQPVVNDIRNRDYDIGMFSDEPDEPARAVINAVEMAVIRRTFDVYGSYHAFQLSALTHQDGTPWDQIYSGGQGRFAVIPNDLISEHFNQLANAQSA